jgi:peptidoglycan-associated lipoprotein
MTHLRSWPVAAAAALLLAACSSTPLDTQAPVAAATPAPAAPANDGPVAAAAPSAAPSGRTVPEYLDPASPLASKRSIYFDYDDYTVKGEYADIVATHGKYLDPHPAVHIRIEGNADERGSAEYNLALGQRRAEAVAKALKLYGVKDSQMEPVSFGSEKPRAAGHDETAWSQNRRADLVYPPQ